MAIPEGEKTTAFGYQEGLGEAKERDPWAHRSKGMRCSTCMYYVPKVATSSPAVPVPELGRCRRHAPTMSGFPAVFPIDWCGDHKLDETKIT